MISIIFPVFNEQDNLLELYTQLDKNVSQVKEREFEFIFVDDCSSDNTHELLKQLYSKDKRVRIIRFARNAGSHAAIACGLAYCRGDAAVVLAADLQDPPALILRLLDEWKKGARIVWGARVKRTGEGAFTKIFSKMYYSLMNWLTTVHSPPFGADIFLADRTVINVFRNISEKHTSIFMTLAWIGFKQATIEYVKEPRGSGTSKWTLGKKIKLALDSLLAFSDVPIRYMSVLGFFTAFLGFLYALHVFWSYMHGSPVEGWSSLMVAILVIGGVQMIMLGVLGEYLWRTFDESLKRPRYIVESVVEFNLNNNSLRA